MKYSPINLPPIIQGFRELEVGEQFQKGDKYFDYDYEQWLNRSDNKRNYNPIHKTGGGHYITIRKIESKSTEEIKEFLKSICIQPESQEDYNKIIEFLSKYFEILWKTNGREFQNNYKLYINNASRIDSTFYPISKEVFTFNQVLQELNLSKPVHITEEQKNSIINTLKTSRAFNEDSALKMKDYFICAELAKKGIIKQFVKTFFIN